MVWLHQFLKANFEDTDGVSLWVGKPKFLFKNFRFLIHTFDILREVQEVEFIFPNKMGVNILAKNSHFSPYFFDEEMSINYPFEPVVVQSIHPKS